LNSTTASRFGWLLAVMPIGFLLVFLVFPILKLLFGTFSLAGFWVVLENPYYVARLVWTFQGAAVSMLLTVLLGVPVAVIFAKFDFWGKRTLEAVLTLPFVVPTIVVAMGFNALFGAKGLLGINLSGTAFLIVLANLFYNFALVVRIVSSYLGTLDTELEDAARVEGASAWQVFILITLPIARPAILASSALVFLYCFASFGVPLLLGAGHFNTLEVEVWQSVSNQLKLAQASSLALLQLLVTFAASVLYTRAQSASQLALEFGAKRPVAKGLARVTLVVCVVFTLILTLSPMLALLRQALFDSGGLTLQFFVNALSVGDGLSDVSLGLALKNAVLFVTLTLLLAVPMGLLYALATQFTGSKILDALSLLPLMISATLLGVAFIVTYPSLTANLGLLIAAYTIGAYPFIVRSVLPAIRAIPLEILEAARVSGATEFQVFWFVTLPLLRPALSTGVAFAFASVIGEFSATLVLSRPEWATLTTVIYTKLGRPGQLGDASAVSVLLLLLTTGGFLLLDRTRGRMG
jgi:thiamine transport system permease protein